MGIEVLIPDFDGADARLRTVMDARPDILNHNLETVKRLQKPVRKRARWDRSLYVLRRAKEMSVEIGYAAHTKSSLMVGLGEERDELTEAFEALREVDVDILTIGQYLRPSEKHLPLDPLLPPRRVRRDEGRGARARVQARRIGAARPVELPRPRPGPGRRAQGPPRRQATLDANGRVVPAAQADRARPDDRASTADTTSRNDVVAPAPRRPRVDDLGRGRARARDRRQLDGRRRCSAISRSGTGSSRRAGSSPRRPGTRDPDRASRTSWPTSINDAAIPAWRIVDPRRLGALVVTAAEDVDAADRRASRRVRRRASSPRAGRGCSIARATASSISPRSRPASAV